MIGAILMAVAAVIAWVYVLTMEEKGPEEKVKNTGVVEQVQTNDGVTKYAIRFTGEKNRSYLVKTPGYTGNTEKYEDGKLVHIQYWLGKKANGAEILDEELIAVPQKEKRGYLLIVSAVLYIAGIVFILI